MMFEELAVEVMAELPVEALSEVLALIESIRSAPHGRPCVMDPGSVEEIREAWSALAWVQYEPFHGTVQIREIG